MACKNAPLPEGYVRLWTIQSEQKWQAALKKGYLAVDGRFVAVFIRPAYRWMMAQMAKRIVGYKGQYPLWAYTQKPDLRKTGWGEGKTVRIEFIAPLEQILKTDYSAFERVLLGTAFLSRTEQEDAEFEQLFPESNAALRQQKIEESWERALDLNPVASGADPEWYGDGSTVQATVARVPLQWVTEVTHFIPRC